MYTKSIVYVLIICVALRRVLDFSVLRKPLVNTEYVMMKDESKMKIESTV